MGIVNTRGEYRRREDVGVREKDEGCYDGRASEGEQEPILGAVEKVPERRVDECEGDGELEGGLPGETTLWHD